MPSSYPVGLDAIKARYGDPTAFVFGSRVLPEWPELILGRLHLPAPLPIAWDLSTRVKVITCHRLIVPDLGAILWRIHDAGLWRALGAYGGCYAWRMQRGASTLSMHCWGIAADLDCGDGRNQFGEMSVVNPAIVEVFEGAGWTWGGRWKRPDGMHFQAASGT